MLPTRHPFQSFWFGDTFSPYEKVCLQSFVDHGHEFHVYTYTKNLEVPSGVLVKDAREILSDEGYFTYGSGPGKGSHAAFSNLFRYRLLAERGGWWVDTDVVCLKDTLPQYRSFYAFENDRIVNGAILYFEPNDPIMRNCFEEASRIGDTAAWGELGPRLLSRMLAEGGCIEHAQNKQLAYEIHHSEAFDLLRPEMCQTLMQRTHNSLFIHLWNEMFRRASLSKTMLPPKGSLLRLFVDRHPVDGWTGEYNAEVLESLLRLNTELSQGHAEVRYLRRQTESLKLSEAKLANKLVRVSEELRYHKRHPLRILARTLPSAILALLRKS